MRQDRENKKMALVKKSARQRLASLFLGVGLALCGVPAQAQTVMAFKIGEATTGMTKQCFYNALGSQHTRTVSAVALCPLSIQVQTIPTYSSPTPQGAPSGGVAFKTGEQTTGMTKQCFYNYLGSQISRTISSVALCPLTIAAN